MSESPHQPAAFINAIAEEGTKAEAVEWLQKTWNDYYAAAAALRKIALMPDEDNEWDGTDKYRSARDVAMAALNWSVLPEPSPAAEKPTQENP